MAQNCNDSSLKSKLAAEGLRILMVEDDPAYRIFVRHLLSSYNKIKFSLVEARTIAESKRILELDYFDAILLDLHLPDSKGLSTVTAVTSLAGASSVIVLTGKEDADSGINAVSLGAQDYLMKHQISNDALIRCIRHAVERRKFDESALRLATIRDFSATLAHDMKVPLIGSRNVLDALLVGKFGELNQQQSEVISRLRACNKDQLTLLEKLLELCRFELEFPNSEQRSMSVLALLAKCCDSVGREPKQKFQLKIPPSLRLNGDYFALSRLFINLLDNAVKFSDPPELPVTISAKQNELGIQIRIHNFSPAISQEIREHLFDKFWHGLPGKTYIASTGLGLYICQRIVRLHRGRLSCQSTAADGTTMTVQLPSE